jgi:hypothetical protein
VRSDKTPGSTHECRLHNLLLFILFSVINVASAALKHKIIRPIQDRNCVTLFLSEIS